MGKATKGFSWHTISTVSFIAISIISYPTFHYIAQDNVTFTVEKAERVSYGNSSRYLIFTEEETFGNPDSITFLKFNSSDIYDRINKGKTYREKVSGTRLPFLSWYRNIIEIQEKSK